MKTSLVNGLTKEGKQQVTSEFLQSKALRERLVEVLNAKNASLRSEVRSKASYDSPSWAYFQADAIGYERAIFEVISLLG